MFSVGPGSSLLLLSGRSSLASRCTALMRQSVLFLEFVPAARRPIRTARICEEAGGSCEAL